MGDIPDISGLYKLERERRPPDIPFPYSPGLAAVSALLIALDAFPVGTFSETLDLLSTSNEQLKASLDDEGLLISAGTDIFLRQISTTVARPSLQDDAAQDFEATKAILIAAGRKFIDDGLAAVAAAIDWALRYFQYDDLIYVSGNGHMSRKFLEDVAKGEGSCFARFVNPQTSAFGLDQLKINQKASYTSIDGEDSELPIVGEVKLIDLASSIQSGPGRDEGVLDKFLLVEAKTLSSDGGAVVSGADLTAACVAKAMNIAVLVLADSARSVPLVSIEAHIEKAAANERHGKTGTNLAYLAPSLIHAIVNNYGPEQSTTSITEDYIRLWF